jgi:hypothetical protein
VRVSNSKNISLNGLLSLHALKYAARGIFPLWDNHARSDAGADTNGDKK